MQNFWKSVSQIYIYGKNKKLLQYNFIDSSFGINYMLLKILNFLNYIILIFEEIGTSVIVTYKISIQIYFLFTLKGNIFTHLTRPQQLLR